MKFGKQIVEKAYHEWRFYYMDYNGLKQLLKGRSQAGAFFQVSDEAKFVECLEREMEKLGELVRHVQHCEGLMNQLEGMSADQRESLQQDIDRLTSDLSHLAAFTRLNHTGFMKILKKHDRRTEFMLLPTYTLRLANKPLFLENVDGLIYRLSKLFDRIRRAEQQSAERPIQNNASSVFVRHTTKYWVPMDSVTDIKCYILRQLPLLVFPTRGSGKIDLTVSSVYFDTPAMDLYKGRLQRTEGAQAIRLRWYGSADPPGEVWIERKVHREDWTGEVSVKERFAIREPFINDYLTGTYVAEDLERRWRQEGKMGEDEIVASVSLAKEIQETIMSMKLRPSLRTIYRRTAFQLPGDARVRISLDTDLCMLREDGANRAGSNWKRDDVETGDLIEGKGLAETEFYRFPYAILEVKLQTESGQETPKWAQSLVESPFVEAVPKFSKYIHGCATLLPTRIDLYPFWLSQMENLDLSGGGRTLEDYLKEQEDEKEEEEAAESEAEDDYDEHYGSAMETGEGVKRERVEKSSSRDSPVIIPILDELPADETDRLLPGTKRATWLGRLFGRKGDSRIRGEEQRENRRIHVPVRVEPKVFFANERTFLSWLHFSIFLGGISTALLGLGDKRAKISGFLFAAVSIMFAIYSLHLYRWRARMIRAKDPGPYDDRVGPILVVIVFLAAMVANVIFTIAG